MSFNTGGRGNISDRVHRQILPPARLLINATHSEVGEGVRIVGKFQVKVPDPRLWLKVALVFIPTVAGAAPGGSPLLWVAGREEGRKPAASNGQFYPVIDVVGTAAAPLAIPVNTGLTGYVFELQTDVDELAGELSILDDYLVANGGRWWLQLTFTQKDSMERREWEHVAAAAGNAIDAQSVAG